MIFLRIFQILELFKKDVSFPQKVNASGSPESLMKNQEAWTSSERRERTIKKQLMPSQGLTKNFQRANNQTWEPFFTFEKNSCKSVNFKNNSISDKGIDDLLKDLTTSLKVHDVQPAGTFDLNLSWSRGITNRSLTIIGSKFKRHLSSLKQLELAFYMCGHLDDNGLVLLGDNISRGLPGLRKLSLNFSRCNKITDTSVEILSSQIVKNLSNLNRLKLDFSGCEKITDESLVHMAARFGRLEKLHLQFMRCDDITDNGFAQISRHLYYTKELILNFTGCTKITDKGLISFVQQTSHSLSGLEHLSLCFSECTGLTDSSLEIVAQKFFNKLKNLKELVLSFSKNPKISDDALETLITHIIEDLPKIEKLSLDFHTCDLSNRGLEKLGNQIKTGLSGLKKLRLNFSVIARTSSKAKEDLRKQLDFIPDFHLH